MELHKEPGRKTENRCRIWESRQTPPLQKASCGKLRRCPTRQDACQINHPHFKSFVDQFQRDSQQQLHQQVAHDVLYSAWRWRKEETLKQQWKSNRIAAGTWEQISTTTTVLKCCWSVCPGFPWCSGVWFSVFWQVSKRLRSWTVLGGRRRFGGGGLQPERRTAELRRRLWHDEQPHTN